MKADILREKFLDFFKSKKHKIVESDSLVPKDDPTVLFTPAGMNQFKKEFLGFNAGFRRAATAQRCLRTDDLDKVGHTRGHHTFFEMLGNFSFGDYFKEEAIAFAWEFLTEELKIDKNRLWVSVYEDDKEAYDIWKDIIKVPQDKIVKLGDKENFWPSEAKAKGPNGPCGPCSEIFFDQLEVWNLVFTQFNRKEGGALEPLPKRNIDTGMGLERLAAVMQGVKSNFETDLFIPLIEEIEVNAKGGNKKEFIYAIADHIRAVTFVIYDGVLPSNEGRGYVARKLIRKCTLHLRVLGLEQPFLYKLVPVVAGIMQQPYPELYGRKENIAEVILAEEKNFISTLESSSSLFKEKFAALLNKADPERAGRIAFQLYDTYGIPLELTRDWLDKHNIKLSQEAFNQGLKQQKDRSKAQSNMSGDVFAAKDLGLGLAATKFSGYKDYSVRAKILKLIKDGGEVKKAAKGEEVSIVLDKSVFYAEAGGQAGDSGEFVKGKNIFKVLDTRATAKVIVHIGQVKDGGFKKGNVVSAKIDRERRLSIARNHTATHLLQAALRKVLGAHVRQQGSLVAEDRLRFDFTHFKDIGAEELQRVEDLVNSYILNNYPLVKKEMPLAQAKKSGALAFFGEKYASRVRVVAIGDISKEFCGGTHLDSTGQISLFKIIQEGSVASGVRRIEAVTGNFAYEEIKEEQRRNQELAEKQSARIKELEKQAKSNKINSLCAAMPDILKKSENINNINVITAIENDVDMESLRRAMDMAKEQANNAVIALATQDIANSRVLLVVGITADLLPKGLDAAAIIRQVAKIIGGSGGGRKDFAQGSGNQPQNLEQAMQELKNIIQKL